MQKPFLTLLFSILFYSISIAQPLQKADAKAWVDSVFNSLNNDQRIAQLMVLRESSYTKDGPVYYDSLITEAITRYNIGGIVFFQGSPEKQANFLNYFQTIAQTPLMVCIDGEWGLGMRFDSVKPLNHQMMLGAVNDPNLIYEYGKLVAEQCKRMGIHVNYAPVVDINNNPDNPVINDRSFGEDKYKVADYGVAYMKGMQDNGVLACAKHFPGHGDVSVDSHLDLPVINKSMAQLDSLELYPFKKMIEAGVGSMMIAHLYIPAIDSTPNTATSLSKKNVTGLLRDELKYDGLTFTDALGMKGVAKFFPGGQIAAQSLIAGNDMLCLPQDVPDAIAKIKDAISENKLTWEDIYEKCRKVLTYKYMYGVATPKTIELDNLTEDLNAGIDDMKRRVAEGAITILSKKDNDFFPLTYSRRNDIAYVGIGIDKENALAQRMKDDYNADAYYFNYKEDDSRISMIVDSLKTNYKKVVIGVHNYSRYPANQFGISNSALKLIQQIKQNNKTLLLDFGNPYALKNFCDFDNLIACYEDDSITQNVAIDILQGHINAAGTLPVTVCEKYKYGSGVYVPRSVMPSANPAEVGINASKLSAIDSIAQSGIDAGAYPGCVVLAAKDGKIFYQKAFGKYNYDTPDPVTVNSIYDMASVTKICATTLSVMKLYDEGKIKLDGTLGDYLPWVRNSNKSKLPIREILLHQAGLVAYIPFFKETLDTSGKPLHSLYRAEKSDSFGIRVAQNLYMRNDFRDTLYQRILDSKLGPMDKYIYSDNDFIFLGKIVEAVSGMTLDNYVAKNFYEPMGLHSIGFYPRKKFDLNRVAPTEFEKHFRGQHLHGDVHDPGSAMFGEVAGHAGLFSSADNIAALMQMLLNGGTYNGKKYINPATINLFTAYNSSISRRGLGFDKPQKDNATTKDWDPYPSRLASPLTFGHTGYTGTCTWADPKTNIVYVFLSNRVNPDGGTNLKLSKMDIRGKIQDAFYKAIQ
ncbi:MAG: glycoside hydrolase family 3 N-terminal domain-containing protein [Ginsengibacter sp.]|jgi:beta-glucosidase-like glycosyl hydrolase/CubicO group peptidase (beta-lactamase class C family)